MYEIRKDGAVLALTDAPNYIQMHPEGFYILCGQKDAQGVAVNGVPYALSEGALGECETVIVVERDTGNILQEQWTVNSITFVALAETGSIDDVTAGEHMESFETWTAAVAYTAGKMRRYRGKLYRCISAHTSQEDWTPDTATSLWKEIADPAEEWPKWAQPIGAHDAYNAGDKVSHNDKKWKSTCDGNVWEPGVYGWTEVTP